MSNNCNRTLTRTVNLGRLPVWCGTYGTEVDPDMGYHKYNMVSYYGSSFINIVEGNKKPPFYPKFDTQNPNLMIDYSFSDDQGEWSGWMFVANALDAKMWADKCQKMVEANFFSMEIDVNGDIYATYENANETDESKKGTIRNCHEDEDSGNIILDYMIDDSLIS